MLQFSPNFKFDTASFKSNLHLIREKLPKDYWEATKHRSEWLNNIPDEKAIWFTDVLTNTDNSGKITVLAAYQITFEGTDARSDIVRRHPKIIAVEFVLDKATLDKLMNKLRIRLSLVPSNNGFS